MSLKVLIVDDFEVIRANLKTILVELGITEIVEAVDGADALEKLNNAQLNPPFDLVFLDWNMPKMSGLDLLNECKSHARFKDIPILMTTAEREKKSVIQALSLGAADYIVKPFTATVIQQRLKKYLTTKKSA